MRLRIALSLAGILALSMIATGSTLANPSTCTDQDPFIYNGGYKDNFAAPVDPAFPSVGLLNHMVGSVQGVVNYDAPMVNGRFGDSFYLQQLGGNYNDPTAARRICKMVIKYRTRSSAGDATNDALHFGTTLGGAYNSAFSFAPVYDTTPPWPIRTKVLPGLNNANKLAALNQLLENPASGAVLDVYMQDDTEIDFLLIKVWYTPLPY